MFELKAEGLPPVLGASYAQLENAFKRLTRLVEGMSQEELEFTGPPGSRNSTATLLAHIALTDRVYLGCITGQMPAEPDPIFGAYEDEQGNLPTVTGIAAKDLLSRQRLVLDMVREYLQTLTDADAGRPVAVPWWPERATLQYVLWHMAGHSMHHQGQIVRLKARQG